MRYIFLCVVLVSGALSAQVVNKTDYNRIPEDSVIVDNGKEDSLKIFKPVINDYKFKTQRGEEKIFDTVFSHEKTYVFSQFNNKDNFGRIQFPNSGQTFNPMVYELNQQQNLAVLPTGKSFNILGIDDIKYYNVKTPTTAFIFHNAPGSGTVLSSTYTQNIGKDFNFSINYMGLRAKGLYQRNLSVNNNFNFGAHYKNKTGRYELYTHYLNQNVNNEENGGIADPSLFLGDDSRFKTRLNLAVRLNNSQSAFSYRRYYLSHDFGLFKINDAFPLRIRHLLMHEGNKYYYVQNGAEEGLFPVKTYPMIPDFTQSAKKYSDKLTNIVSLVFDREKFKLDAGLKYQNITLGVNQIYLDNQIQNDITWKESRIGVDGNLQIKLWDKLDLNSSAEYTTGSKFGNFIRINNKVAFIPAEGFAVEGKLNFQSAAPSFNLLMNGSQYRDFNYSNSGFKNQSVLEAGGVVKLKWFDAAAFLNYFSIGNYAYINSNFQMQQSTSSVNITQAGGEATFKYNKFRLNGKVLFQSAINNKDLIPLPGFVGRANVYFQSKMFKDAAEIQAGVKAYYFSKFASREFFPVLNEFVLPGTTSYSIGGQPIMDVYINLKVKTMMFFIEGQHINTTLMKNKSFAAPYYPVADFRLNLGIVWYIFS
ncbi:putative porin [Elizabethkingia meningoseptica]|uniref:putative porin n=1 Tax=Elizabethkingia meningoseptica TaxID=238 RepID=UPI00389291E9